MDAAGTLSTPLPRGRTWREYFLSPLDEGGANLKPNFTSSSYTDDDLGENVTRLPFRPTLAAGASAAVVTSGEQHISIFVLCCPALAA